MLYIKIIGILIICLNIGGICFLLYMAALKLKDRFFSEASSSLPENLPDGNKPGRPAAKQPVNVDNNDIVPDEDDLLKDMDLSVFDDLDLDDFD